MIAFGVDTNVSSRRGGSAYCCNVAAAAPSRRLPLWPGKDPKQEYGQARADECQTPRGSWKEQRRPRRRVS
jgi:hypothetical protein